jgi:hypothetical protein
MLTVSTQQTLPPRSRRKRLLKPRPQNRSKLDNTPRCLVPSVMSRKISQLLDWCQSKRITIDPRLSVVENQNGDITVCNASENTIANLTTRNSSPTSTRQPCADSSASSRYHSKEFHLVDTDMCSVEEARLASRIPGYLYSAFWT